MGAEPLVDPLVPAFADEVEVEVAEQLDGGRAHCSSSSIRTIPATGMPTQSGRLSSS